MVSVVHMLPRGGLTAHAELEWFKGQRPLVPFLQSPRELGDCCSTLNMITAP